MGMTTTPWNAPDGGPDRQLRFEATIHQGERERALSRVADLDLDRVPDPHALDARALLELHLEGLDGVADVAVGRGDRQLLLVKGAVPGAKNGQVIVKPAVKTKAQKGA